MLPEDFDPFHTTASAAPASLLEAAGRPPDAFETDDPLADLLGSPTLAVGVDQSFGLAQSSATTSDPLLDFESGRDLLRDAASALGPADPLAMFGDPGPAQVRPPMDDHLDAVHAAFEPPVLGPTPPSMAAPPVGKSDDTMQALWQAFCRGAGIALPVPADPAQAAQAMQLAGHLLQAAVQGTRDLMAVRASTKYELRAAVTHVQAQRNNPLKFAPDTRAALEQLLQPAMRGFLAGPAAMDDAMQDLVGHSIGSVAGMRAAIEGLLDRFAPETLEQTLGQGSLLSSLLQSPRKARLWELYLQRYRSLREDAQEDFHLVFGRAFVAAYEQQVQTLRQRDTQGR